MNDATPSKGACTYRLRTLIAVAAASAIIGFAIARLVLFLRSFSG